MHTTVTFDTGDTAKVTRFNDLGHAQYDFGDDGRIHVQPAYFGQPDRLAVTIGLGRPGDQSGYNLTGLHVDDFLLTGTVMCAGHGMTPQPHPHSPNKFPLDDIDDAATRDRAAMLLAGVARHFYDSHQ